ncbi:hypothetical protein L1987_60272 [Smallanthus sonchifolius]|uniref:Uncharacterized protein n=1 Tax=Smallanthus sonchifolius TaxID=185202 RepID=A0ACB9D7T3_9ASTR|nr:hypothetical protein L1987_60272 [Smallanthus sonchifolius]
MKTLSSSSELPSMSIKTKQDWRFSTSSRPLSGEIMSKHNSSIEVYYGGATVAVPFKWESQPGTPRVRFHETPLPPLTPPPSFLLNSPKTPINKISKPKGGILHAIFPRLTSCTRKNYNSPASPASSESSSLFSPSSYSDSPSPLYIPNNHRQNRRKSFEDQDGYGSSVSTLCFRMRCSATPQPHGCK